MYIQGKYLLGAVSDISECRTIFDEVAKECPQIMKCRKQEEDASAIFALAYETEKHTEKAGETLLPVAAGRLLFLEDCYEVDEIAVKKEYRRKKYGDFIVRMLVDKAFVMGAQEVIAVVPQECEAFFTSIGFVETKEEAKGFDERKNCGKRMKIMPTTCKRDCGKH